MIVVRFKVQSRPDKTERVRAAFETVIGPSRGVDGVISSTSPRISPTPTHSSLSRFSRIVRRSSGKNHCRRFAGRSPSSRSRLSPNPKRPSFTFRRPSRGETEDAGCAYEFLATELHTTLTT